jgi:hypothetical protein
MEGSACILDKLSFKLWGEEGRHEGRRKVGRSKGGGDGRVPLQQAGSVRDSWQTHSSTIRGFSES